MAHSGGHKVIVRLFAFVAAFGVAISGLVAQAQPAYAVPLLGCKYGGSGSVYIASATNVPADLKAAVSSARINWNAKISSIRFVSGAAPSSSSRKLLVQMSSVLGSSVIARIDDPSSAALCGSSGRWTSNTAELEWSLAFDHDSLGSTGRRSAAAHEMGHALGLAHATTSPTSECNYAKSVMHTHFSFWQCGWGTEPWALDISGVEGLY